MLLNSAWWSVLTARVTLVALMAWPVVVRCSEPTEQPNILFLLIDDQRNDTLGCAGHPVVKTPMVDSLAAGGMRFRNAFVTTSICAASRASIFTGLHERTHGYTFGAPPIRESQMSESYPALLRKSGYRTGFIGKYGVRTENGQDSQRFDFFSRFELPHYYKKQADGTMRHETELAGDEAVAFLRGNPTGQPFCLSVSFNAVHAEDDDKENQYPVPESVAGMYDGVTMPRPRLDDPAIFESQPDFLKNSLNANVISGDGTRPKNTRRTCEPISS